jgi:hypothetical protein
LSLARKKAGDDRFDGRLVMLRGFDPRSGGAVDVPDPYYGDDLDFETCLEMVEAGCRGLVAELVDRFGGPADDDGRSGGPGAGAGRGEGLPSER